MHDAKGRELKVGDIVLVPARITNASPTPDYCNVYGRKPDGHKETYCTNAGVVLLASAESDVLGPPEDPDARKGQ